jgi:hypothetical protein
VTIGEVEPGSTGAGAFSEGGTSGAEIGVIGEEELVEGSSNKYQKIQKSEFQAHRQVGTPVQNFCWY